MTLEISARRTGTEILRGIQSGAVAPPPLAGLIGFRVAEVDDGRVAFELEPRAELENLAGQLHGGVAAALLDTALGAAVHTVLPADQGFVTLDLKITYLRPLTLRSGLIRGEGRLLHRGRTNAYAEGEVRDARGALCAHAVGNFSLMQT